ncbi:MAG: AMIN domain-containing protein, partial [Candidatus Rokubacteria bacterium]|nr:AMIN domain-containing protein [Candidatus Rokubacteria bacterium]
MPPVSMRRIARLVPLLHLMALAAAAETPASAVELTDVAVQSRSEGLRVEIKTSGAPKYRSEFMGGPFRLVLDFEDATYAWAKAPVTVGADPV